MIRGADMEEMAPQGHSLLMLALQVRFLRRLRVMGGQREAVAWADDAPLLPLVGWCNSGSCD